MITSEISEYEAKMESIALDVTSKYYRLKDSIQRNELSFEERMDCANHIFEDLDSAELNHFRMEIGSHSGSRSGMINLASNNYLNFSNHPEIIRAANEAN